MREFAFMRWFIAGSTGPELARYVLWLQENDLWLFCGGRSCDCRPGQLGRIYVHIVSRVEMPRFPSLVCRTEDGITAFFFVIKLAVDFFLIAAALPPKRACDVVVGEATVLIVAIAVAPVPTHSCMCCRVVSRQSWGCTICSSHRRRRHAPLPSRSRRFTPTKDIVGRTRGAKVRGAMLHGRFVVLACSKVESLEHTRIRSGLFC